MMNNFDDNDFYDGYDNDVRQIDNDIYQDKVKIDKYISDTIIGIKKFGRENIIESRIPKKYKIPFKIRLNNFINKLINTIM